VEHAVAFGLPHKEKGEFPAAAVELRTGFMVNESELLEWCRNNLAPYKAPRRIWILESGSLPRNDNGKLLRRVLRERYSQEMD
jgi:acyl-CoA synthetase (AMP-forming)/AMP-acid ligase II